MKHSAHQGSLFTPAIIIVDLAQASPAQRRSTTLTLHPDPEPHTIEITRDALAVQVITDFVKHQRWEKELTLGASDDELSTALGTCWVSTPTLDIHCNVNPNPRLICTSKMGQELLRLEGSEIAALIRTHAQIPTVPTEDERARRLKQHLDKERAKARHDIFTAAQAILGDKSRKRQQGFTQAFVDLLFTDNFLAEENQSATLERMTSMLIAHQWTTLKAMKAAIELVERAASTWRHIESYWLDRNYFNN
jgi:hypothetical protein